MEGRRQLLEQLRDRLTEEIQAVEGPGLAPLARELRAVLSEIDAIPAVNSKAPADQIGKRREERRRRAAGE